LLHFFILPRLVFLEDGEEKGTRRRTDFMVAIERMNNVANMYVLLAELMPDGSMYPWIFHAIQTPRK
jgi:hypothetical protein